MLFDQNKGGVTFRLGARLALEPKRLLQNFAGEAEKLHAGLQRQGQTGVLAKEQQKRFKARQRKRTELSQKKVRHEDESLI